ncbi:hypothetical protein RJ639_019056 [Escallonia herrerae]|uniref:Uncharacterized protein n=1 Tax=Escallonia herrerae TaxID=1293975 RepID=A0AA88VBT3_9ASTE|nr:hypothetical protein RJ639_019056 [Escallonia herrerae]
MGPGGPGGFGGPGGPGGFGGPGGPGWGPGGPGWGPGPGGFFGGFADGICNMISTCWLKLFLEFAVCPVSAAVGCCKIVSVGPVVMDLLADPVLTEVLIYEEVKLLAPHFH